MKEMLRQEAARSRDRTEPGKWRELGRLRDWHGCSECTLNVVDIRHRSQCIGMIIHVQSE